MRKNASVALLCVLALAVVTGAFAAVPVAAGSQDLRATHTQITLWGSATSPDNGWGLTQTTIAQPGPQLTIDLGETVSFQLFSADGAPHTLVIDYDSDGVKDANEPESPQFSSDTTAVSWSFTPDRSGTFQYFCGIHGQGVQRGTIVVPAPAAPPPTDNTGLIVGGILVVVLIAVAAAVMLRKKPKPPAQPPPQP